MDIEGYVTRGPSGSRIKADLHVRIVWPACGNGYMPFGAKDGEALTSLSDPVNRRILAVSEDTLTGFHRDPIGEIATRADVPVDVVIGRIRVLLEAGVIRRVRQTLLTHNLAEGALVAWRIPEEGLDEAFRMMAEEDPFTGHVGYRGRCEERRGYRRAGLW